MARLEGPARSGAGRGLLFLVFPNIGQLHAHGVLFIDIFFLVDPEIPFFFFEEVKAFLFQLGTVQK